MFCVSSFLLPWFCIYLFLDCSFVFKLRCQILTYFYMRKFDFHFLWCLGTEATPYKYYSIIKLELPTLFENMPSSHAQPPRLLLKLCSSALNWLALTAWCCISCLNKHYFINMCGHRDSFTPFRIRDGCFFFAVKAEIVTYRYYYSGL